MSVRAYIIEDNGVNYGVMNYNGVLIRKTMIREYVEPLFNLGKDDGILEIFENYGNVLSTQHYDICYVEMTQDSWDMYKYDIEMGDYEKPKNKNEIEIIEKIDNYLKVHEYMFCRCY